METKHAETLLSELWSNLLPAKFPKTKCVEALSEHLNVTKRNAYARIVDNTLLAKDVSFLYKNYAIGYSCDTGFFFDSSYFDFIQQREEMEMAKMFGLSKSVA